MSFAPHQVYSRSLLGTHGYPLWTPQLKTQLRESYQLEGLKIGDVGIVSSNDGSFDVLFNITLERNEQPYPELVREDFTPIILDQQRDLATQPDAVAAHGVISSDSVELMSQEVHSCDQDPPRAEYEFSLSMEEGAVLILPEGAQSFDLANEKIFLGEAIRHGIDWYERATEEAGRLIGNDSLYLITGFHKARSWSVGAAGRIRPNIQKPRSVKFKVGQIDQGRATARAYQWAATRRFAGRIGPTYPYEIPNYVCNERLRHGVNQTVFVRGFRITVNKILFLKTVSVKTRQGTFFGFGAYIDKLWGGPSESTPSSGASPTDNMVDQDTSMDHSQLYMDPRMTIDRLSDVSKAFHPGDLINRYMLKKGLLELADFSCEKRLEEVLSKNCRITVEDGAVYLEGSSRRHSEWTLLSSPLTGNIQMPGLSDLYPECTGREQAKDEALGLGDRPQHAPTYTSPATHASEEGGTTITSIRATDVAFGLKQVPTGFYAVVRHSGLEWRTENKHLSANNDVEWSGPIPVPSDLSATVCLEVFASFGFQPMLGAGERVQMLVAPVQQLLDRSENDVPFTFFPNDGDIVSRRSSILVTVKRQKGESGSSTLGVFGSVETSLKTPTDVISVQSPEGVIHSDVSQTISESAPLPHLKMGPNTSSVGRNLDSRYREVTTPPSSGVSSSDFLITPPSTVESPEGESLGERGEEEGRHSTTATARAGETRPAHGHQNKPKKGKEVQRPKRSHLTGHVAPSTSRKLPAQQQCPAQPEGAGEMSIISSGSSRLTSGLTRESRAETSVNELNAIQPSTGSAYPPQEQPLVRPEGFTGRVTASGTTLNPNTQPWNSIVVANSSSEEYETTDGEDSEEWTSDDMDAADKTREAEIRLREAALVLEAQHQRELSAKVPEHSYSNLNRTQSGLLSQLMHPSIYPPNHPYRIRRPSADIFAPVPLRSGSPYVSAAALPMAAQITAISSSKTPSLSVMKWQESEKEPPRPKEPPKEQEMEDGDSDDTYDKIQMYNLPAPPPPMTPRTTRRRMLKAELQESMRRQLLWDRQFSSKTGPALPARRAAQGMGELRPLTPSTSDNIVDTSVSTEQDSHGTQSDHDYHHSGW